MKRSLPFIIVAVVAVATLTSGMILYRANRPAPLIISKEANADRDKEKPRHIRGATKAAVTLEEFGDFQCPPCGMLAGPLKQIEEENSANLRVIFRHFPFAIHQHAVEAAVAAEAAGLQGKFWEMHDLLYREQANWSKAPDVRQLFSAYAGLLGLDLERFNRDTQNPELKQRIAADQKLGTSLGVNTTPSLFINNQSVPPNSLSPDALRKAIKEAIDKSKAGPG